jgi:site-specific recombinase XerD
MGTTRYAIETLTPAEVTRLLKVCSSTAPTGIRNRAMLAIMWRAGLRVAELLALKASDIDSEAGTIRVLHGKGNRARIMGIDEGALAMVQVWIAARHRLGLSRAVLFCTLGGKPVSDVYVRAMMKRLARKAGIDKRVHAHGLRHTHAFELAAEGVPVNVISRQLGHSSSAVTARYIDHVAPQDVITMGRARAWSAV